MKTKIILIGVLSAIILASCTNTNNKDKKQTNLEQTETNMTQKTINLTKAEFLTKVANYEENPEEWKYIGDKPCLIDFYADWCGPCKMVAPILEELAEEYEDDIYIYKVDTEAEQELAAAFGIRSIPSILFCPMDEQPQMAQGALPKDGFKKAIDEVLLKKE
ncbi:MAG: thioredoxin [Bacteroidales bacterium]|nr:thioredoxin [Bacteroidales bacterium]